VLACKDARQCGNSRKKESGEFCGEISSSQGKSEHELGTWKVTSGKSALTKGDKSIRQSRDIVKEEPMLHTQGIKATSDRHSGKGINQQIPIRYSGRTKRMCAVDVGRDIEEL